MTQKLILEAIICAQKNAVQPQVENNHHPLLTGKNNFLQLMNKLDNEQNPYFPSQI
jgi:hypothetical protein